MVVEASCAKSAGGSRDLILVETSQLAVHSKPPEDQGLPKRGAGVEYLSACPFAVHEAGGA